MNPSDWYGAPAGGGGALVTLRNRAGLAATVATHGATLVALEVPDRAGRLANVVLGYRTLAEYVAGRRFFGALVGRCCNRIRDARFELGDDAFELDRNDGRNHLHGGRRGLHAVEWELRSADAAAATFAYASPDGEMGYPGRLAVEAEYRVTEGNELHVLVRATTDRTTICNFTTHPYFNLRGEGEGDVLGHELTLFAEEYTPVGDGLIPTGAILPVAGTPFDFRAPRTIGQRLGEPHEQLRLADGYDHNFVVAEHDGSLRPIAIVREPASGRRLTVSSTEPGVQLYGGQVLDGSDVGPSGRPYGRYAGFCLEPQQFPDAVHHPTFPSVVLRPGERYEARTTFGFGGG